MSRYSGRYRRGARQTEREIKRLEADGRNAKTLLERTKAYRFPNREGKTQS